MLGMGPAFFFKFGIGVAVGGMGHCATNLTVDCYRPLFARVPSFCVERYRKSKGVMCYVILTRFIINVGH